MTWHTLEMWLEKVAYEKGCSKGKVREVEHEWERGPTVAMTLVGTWESRRKELGGTRPLRVAPTTNKCAGGLGYVSLREPLVCSTGSGVFQFGPLEKMKFVWNYKEKLILQADK